MKFEEALNETIIGRPGNYKVVSHTGKNLGSGYRSRKAAKKRLQQVEYFKNKG